MVKQEGLASGSGCRPGGEEQKGFSATLQDAKQGFDGDWGPTSGDIDRELAQLTPPDQWPECREIDPFT